MSGQLVGVARKVCNSWVERPFIVEVDDIEKATTCDKDDSERRRRQEKFIVAYFVLKVKMLLLFLSFIMRRT